MRRAKAVGVLLLAGLMGVGCDRDEGDGSEQPEAGALPPGSRALPAGVTPSMAEEGRALFGTTCSVCHGPDAGGTQLGPSLRDGEWIHISGQLPEIERVITTGVEEPRDHPVPMPPLGGGVYTPEEVRSLAAYVYSLAGGRSVAAPVDSVPASP